MFSFSPFFSNISCVFNGSKAGTGWQILLKTNIEILKLSQKSPPGHTCLEIHFQIVVVAKWEPPSSDSQPFKHLYQFIHSGLFNQHEEHWLFTGDASIYLEMASLSGTPRTPAWLLWTEFRLQVSREFPPPTPILSTLKIDPFSAKCY